jgi:hypothetical protein
MHFITQTKQKEKQPNAPSNRVLSQKLPLQMTAFTLDRLYVIYGKLVDGIWNG